MFFDRDGCLNDDIGYLFDIAKFRWLPGAVEAVRLVNRSGALAFVVTNQSGIARGLYTPADVEAVHAWMSAELAKVGAWIDAYRFCPHHPTAGEGPFTRACDCRKPEPGMLLGLSNAWGVDPRRSFMVATNRAIKRRRRRRGSRAIRWSREACWPRCATACIPIALRQPPHPSHPE